MRYAHQHSMLCAHAELRNRLFQRRFLDRRRRIPLAPTRPQRRNIGLCACAKSCKQSLRRRRVRSVLCATAQCAVRTLRTKKSPFSAAISCPQAAHYLGAAKTVPRRGEGVCCVTIGRKNQATSHTFLYYNRFLALSQTLLFAICNFLW